MTDFFLQTALSNVCLALALAAVAVVVERTAKRPALAHLLWVLVLVKLVTPPVVTVPVVALPGPPDRAVVAFEGESQQERAVAGNLEAGADGRQQGAAAQTGGGAIDDYLSAAARSPILAQGKAGLSLIWLLGSALVLAWSLVRIYRFNRLLRTESESARQELQALAVGIANRLGLKAAPTVYTTSARLSPMVWWVGGKVRIVMPAALLGQMERRHFQWILAHELAHVRRRDYLVRWIEWVACVCFWWNPLVWWARQHLRANEELCCDALVVSSLKPRPHTYANSLLVAVEYLVCSSLRPPAVASEINSGGFLERRFKMIVSGQPKRRAPRWLQACVLLCAVVVLPLGVTYAQDCSDKTDGYLEEVGAKLQAEVAAGNMTAGDAEAKMAAIEKGIAVREEYAAVAAELKAAVEAGEMTEEEAKARWEAFENEAAAKRKEAEYDAVASRLAAAVDAGEITEEEADAKWAAFEEEVAAREECEAVAAELKAAVEAGEITEEEARTRWEGYEKRIAAKECEDFGRRIRAAVAAGELTEEEATAKWEGYKKRLADGEEWEAVGQKIRAAVEAGELTEEQAEEKWAEIKKAAAAREKCEALGLKLRAAVEAGEMTEEEAKARWEAFEERVAAARAAREAAASELKAAVAAGEMTEEEAKAKWEACEKQQAAEEK